MADNQTPPTTPTPGSGKGGGYGKRPLWQWIVIYVVLAIIVYGVIYYLAFGRKGSSSPYGGATNIYQTK